MKVYRANNGKKKISAVTVCLLLTVVMAIGGTLAYLFMVTAPVENTFVPAKVGNFVAEDFADNVKTNVRIQNSIRGQVDSEIVDAYIRATFVVNWKDSTGKYLLPAKSTDYNVDMGSNDWLKGDDGFYYYNKSVAPGAYTTNLIDRIELDESAVAPKEGYTLNVEIISQSIQSTPDTPVDVWDNDKVNVTGNNGLLSIANNQ